jgi:hypothetical protein
VLAAASPGRSTPVDHAERQKLHDEMHQWYFDEGNGIFMSTPARHLHRSRVLAGCLVVALIWCRSRPCQRSRAIIPVSGHHRSPYEVLWVLANVGMIGGVVGWLAMDAAQPRLVGLVGGALAIAGH